jgi:hypothetical protein
MTVVDSTAGELAVRRTRARRRIDGLLILSLIVALQLVWLAGLGYAAYRLAT